MEPCGGGGGSLRLIGGGAQGRLPPPSMDRLIVMRPAGRDAVGAHSPTSPLFSFYWGRGGTDPHFPSPPPPSRLALGGVGGAGGAQRCFLASGFVQLLVTLKGFYTDGIEIKNPKWC